MFELFTTVLLQLATLGHQPATATAQPAGQPTTQTDAEGGWGGWGNDVNQTEADGGWGGWGNDVNGK